MFSYSFFQNDQWARVTAFGEIDLDHSDRFAMALDSLNNSGAATVEVDMERVNYINSEAIGLLVNLRKRVDDRGGEMKVLKPTGPVHQMLRQCGLEQFLNVEGATATWVAATQQDSALCRA